MLNYEELFVYNEKEDRYEFDLEEWALDVGTPLRVILTRKKPKVEDRYKEVVDGLLATHDWATHRHQERIQAALSLLEDLMLERKANGGKG